MFSNRQFSYNENIDSLIHQFQSCISSGDLEMSEEIYSRLQRKYTELSKDEKGRYYSKIMELYNKVLEHQVTLGVAY